MKKQNRFYFGLVALTLTFSIWSAPSLAAPYYEGKTLSVFAGTRPGGGADTNFRIIRPFLKKYIPGHPEIVIKHIPGGGGQKVWNFIYEKAKPDGLSIVFSAWNPVGRVTGSRGLRADYTKMKFVAGQALPRMSYIRTDAKTGIKSRNDLMSVKNLVLGGNRPNSVLDLSIRISLELLGLNDYTYVPGLNPAKAYAAMRSGEVNLTTAGINFYRARVVNTMVKSGEATALFYYPLVRTDGSLKTLSYIKEMPSFDEFYMKVKGKKPSGLAYDALKWINMVTGNMLYTSFAPPGTPDKAINALRAGFKKAAEDPEFAKQSIKIIGIPPEFVAIKEGEAIVRNVDKIDPKIKKYLSKMVKSK